MQLNFKKFGAGSPVIILHGLLGSLDNWQTMAKKLAEHFEVFIIDQRNHGRSPHSDAFSYDLLAEDLGEFMRQQNIPCGNIMGHSMGGKAAMKFALTCPEKVLKLIVVDIAPAEYPAAGYEIFEALFSAKANEATSREQVAEVLRSKLNDEITVQFLMKSVMRDESGKNFVWRFNIDSLSENFLKISEAITSTHPFTGKTLFIKGEKSNYINAANYNSIAELFPNNQLTEMKGAGHWVHADKPEEFFEVALEFLTG